MGILNEKYSVFFRSISYLFVVLSLSGRYEAHDGALLSTLAVVDAVNISASGNSLPLPEYCASPEQIEDVAVRPLPAHILSKYAPEIVSVQIVARHGQRAPYAKIRCWETEPNPMTMEWTCPSEEVMSADLPESIDAEGDLHSTGVTRFFRKRYDGGENVLKGNCKVGQLLPGGRDQHRHLGRILAQTYTGNGSSALFNTSHLQPGFLQDIYLRSDDVSRVISSVEDLFNGFFPPSKSTLQEAGVDASVVLHLMDYATEIITDSDKRCPRLSQVREAVKRSKSQKLLDEKHASLTRELEQAVGKFEWDNLGECLYVSRCAEKPLPERLTSKVFVNALTAVDERNKLMMTFSSSLYSTLAMGPLIYELKERIVATMDAREKKENAGKKSGVGHEKLAIYGAHDFTIMPLLAALQGEQWSGKWAPYASYLAIEIYRLTKNSKIFGDRYAARVLYQGKPIRVRGCEDAEFCTWDTFDTVTTSFAKAQTDMDCGLQKFKGETSMALSGSANQAADETHGMTNRASNSSYSAINIVILFSALCTVGAVMLVGLFLVLRSRRSTSVERNVADMNTTVGTSGHKVAYRSLPTSAVAGYGSTGLAHDSTVLSTTSCTLNSSSSVTEDKRSTASPFTTAHVVCASSPNPNEEGVSTTRENTNGLHQTSQYSDDVHI